MKDITKEDLTRVLGHIIDRLCHAQSESFNVSAALLSDGILEYLTHHEMGVLKAFPHAIQETHEQIDNPLEEEGPKVSLIVEPTYSIAIGRARAWAERDRRNRSCYHTPKGKMEWYARLEKLLRDYPDEREIDIVCLSDDTMCQIVSTTLTEQDVADQF